MKATLEKQLLEELGPGSYLGIVRHGNVHMGKLSYETGVVRDEIINDKLTIDVLTVLNGDEIIPYIPIRGLEDVILGEDLFKKFGGLKQFRYAICFLPQKRKIFPGYTDEDLRAMYSEGRNEIVDNIMETEEKCKKMMIEDAKEFAKIEVAAEVDND